MSESGTVRERGGSRREDVTTFAPLQHTDLAALAHQAIRAKILLRELKVGSQVPVDQIAIELGVSRTPVIDALKRLSTEGLIDIQARRGCFVRGLTPVDISDILDTREALELYGIRQAFRRGRHLRLAARLAECDKQMRKVTSGEVFKNYDEFCGWDRAFHLAIVDDSDNRSLTDTYVNLHAHVHIMRVHYLRTIKSASIVNSDHAGIIAALEKADQAAVEDALSAHLNAIKERVVLNLKEEGGKL